MLKQLKKVVEKKDTVSTLSKTTKKTTTKKDLVCADDERSFWVTNGQILNSLVALNEAFQEMEKTVFLIMYQKIKMILLSGWN